MKKFGPVVLTYKAESGIWFTLTIEVEQNDAWRHVKKIHFILGSKIKAKEATLIVHHYQTLCQHTVAKPVKEAMPLCIKFCTDLIIAIDRIVCDNVPNLLFLGSDESLLYSAITHKSNTYLRHETTFAHMDPNQGIDDYTIVRKSCKMPTIKVHKKLEEYRTDNDLVPPGAYESESGLSGSQRRKLKIGTVEISLKHVDIGRGSGTFEVCEIKGILPQSKLPDSYLTSDEFVAWYDPVQKIIMNKRGEYLEAGHIYTKTAIRAKVAYLVQCGRHLHEINEKLKSIPKQSKSRHKVVIQI